MNIKTFQDLLVWEKSHALVLEIYKITKQFPEQERFGLISQLRRAVSSIPMNISEGYNRSSTRDFAHFLNIAESSLEEVKYQLILSRDLEYVSEKTYVSLKDACDEIGRMLCGLVKKLTTYHLSLTTAVRRPL